MKTKKLNLILIFLFAGVMLFLAFNKHSKSGYFNYHSEIWADKAGYYVYLPMAFDYHFSPVQFPDSIDQKTGNGFWLDYKNEKVITKYTYGVALMQSPFYLVANNAALLLKQKRDGFSPIFHWSINVAAVFWLIIGFLCLYNYLLRYLRRITVLMVLLLILFGTNLFYYSVDETGMSHIYSFALFSIFLNRLDIYFKRKRFSITGILVLSLTGSLIVLIRPTNILFIIATFFLTTATDNNLKKWIVDSLFTPKFLIALLPIIFVFLPQLFYNEYAYQKYFVDTYVNEGFNWLNPRPFVTLFSPDNGLFLYTPLFFVILYSFFLSYSHSSLKRVGVIMGITFIALTYVFSSWGQTDFGCSFGARSFVEYYALFSIPLGLMVENAMTKSKTYQLTLGLLVIVLIVYNLKLTYSYDECFYGKGYWDWQEFTTLLFSPTK